MACSMAAAVLVDLVAGGMLLAHLQCRLICCMQVLADSGVGAGGEFLGEKTGVMYCLGKRLVNMLSNYLNYLLFFTSV